MLSLRDGRRDAGPSHFLEGEREMVSSKFVSVSVGGEITTHMRHPTGNYATLCGLDGDDPDVAVQQQTIMSLAKRIDCNDCILIWRIARSYRPHEIVISR